MSCAFSTGVPTGGRSEIHSGMSLTQTWLMDYARTPCVKRRAASASLSIFPLSGLSRMCAPHAMPRPRRAHCTGLMIPSCSKRGSAGGQAQTGAHNRDGEGTNGLIADHN